MSNRIVPRVEDLHRPYEQISTRKSDLDQRATELRAVTADLRRQIATAVDVDTVKAKREAIISGQPFHDADSLKARLDEALRELRDIEDANWEVSIRVRAEHLRGSQLVANTFQARACRNAWSALGRRGRSGGGQIGN